MTLQMLLETTVEHGTVPGAAALVVHGDDIEVAAGTCAHVAPSSGTVGILLTQVQMTGGTSTQLMREFWQYAFSAS